MFMYAGLMTIVMLLFIYMARVYTNTQRKIKEAEENQVTSEIDAKL